ncbi:MAG TPA: FAD-binding oxidoreductase [Candidatus Limnocylindria bacterium]|jgi:FAD/FMN-containing dehydrogenase|nr:FAD-binding oxidoreductase [Candidatus Limnocylindria bacterium]
MDRRRFLRAAGIVSASALTACLAPPSSASPTPSAAPSATAGPTATPSARIPDWGALARALKGELVRPSDPAYDARRVLYNTRFDAIRPDAIARCVSVDDVRECVAFAANTGIPLALRSGGHNYGGWSTGTGLVIDTGPLNSIEVRPDRVIVGAGARLIDVYAKTASAGVGIPGGSCATVGIAGLALGGGIGVMSRAWGLTCDDLVAAEIVTAAAKVLTCDQAREPDLFWALRGGGGGSFGVVTSLTLRTHPASALALGFLSWPWTAANAVIAGWQEWMRQAPDALWSNLHVDADRSGAQLTLYAVHSGSTASLSTQLDRLDALTGARAIRSVGSRSFMDTMMVDAGCLGRTVSQCHLIGETPDGALRRETYAAKSIVATAPLSAEAISVLTTGLDGPLEGDSYSVIYDALGGAVARVPSDTTAFPHRGALGVLQFVHSWSPDAPAAQTLFRAYHERVRTLVGPAAYANYADPDLVDWPEAYYGANYARLRRVKRAYDPKELFTFAQAIRPA